jgi:HK97 family phage prohead protease
MKHGTKDYISEYGTAERRFFSAGITFRASADGKTKTYRGYGAKFNTLSEDLGGFKERIAPGFFDKVLANDVRILRDHTPTLILGRTSASTARIGVDDIGLWYEYEDPGTSYSNDLAISIERGDVNQSSFAFNLDYASGLADKWEKQGDGSWIRTLLAASSLYDCSPVTYPAYADTSIAERSLKKLQIPDGVMNAQDLIDMDADIMKRDLHKVKIYSVA